MDVNVMAVAENGQIGEVVNRRVGRSTLPSRATMMDNSTTGTIAAEAVSRRLTRPASSLERLVGTTRRHRITLAHNRRIMSVVGFVWEMSDADWKLNRSDDSLTS
jgi:hypothetical protein